MQSTPTDCEVIVQLALMLRKRLEAGEGTCGRDVVSAELYYLVPGSSSAMAQKWLSHAQDAVGTDYVLSYHPDDDELRLKPAVPRE
jgi:hypothetical protein